MFFMKAASSVNVIHVVFIPLAATTNSSEKKPLQSRKSTKPILFSITHKRKTE